MKADIHLAVTGSTAMCVRLSCYHKANQVCVYACMHHHNYSVHFMCRGKLHANNFSVLLPVIS